MILRPYQHTMVERALTALGKRGNTLAVGSTGCGKTIILSAVAGKLGGKQCVLQHRDELVAQNLRKFRAVNPKRSTGLYTADAKTWRGDTTFAMVQTLTRNLSSIPELDALIIDEAHHAAAPGYLKIVEAVKDKNPGCKIFGVTATPARGDGKGLRAVFDNCSAQISLHYLVSMGFLVRPRTFVMYLGGTDESWRPCARPVPASMTCTSFCGAGPGCTQRGRGASNAQAGRGPQDHRVLFRWNMPVMCWKPFWPQACTRHSGHGEMAAGERKALLGRDKVDAANGVAGADPTWPCSPG